MPIRLTDEEIEGIVEEIREMDLVPDPRYVGDIVAKAQLKKVYTWGDEVCSDKEHHPYYDCMLRRVCSPCWEALLEEVKDVDKQEKV